MALSRREKYFVVFFTLSVLANLVWPFLALLTLPLASAVAVAAAILFFMGVIITLPMKDVLNDSSSAKGQNKLVLFSYNFTYLTMFVVLFLIVLVAQIWELTPSKRFAAGLVSIISPIISVILVGFLPIDFNSDVLSGFLFVGFLALYAISFVVLLLRGVFGLIGLVPRNWKEEPAGAKK